ncbi:MAG: protein phosphatase 2C domain-containing protein [Acidobacteria bacterium]|nr:protein phosphatase 2C domain-containing protein [Acidobacteriota bacterium]
MLTVSAAALTHTGLRREGNEDCFVARPGLGLFVVCDGMGGHAAGEVASRVAVDAIESFIQHSDGLTRDFAWPVGFRPEVGISGNRLITAFLLANRDIQQRMTDEPALRGMATTGVALLLEPGDEAGAGGVRGLVAHVGDSRAYLWRDGELEQITRDHSWVEEQISAGAMTAGDARTHPWRNLVTRALSGGEDPNVELTPVVLERGDRFIVCSDGLTTPLTDEAIGRVVSKAPPGALDLLCRALIHAANEAGGPDNITVVALEVS